MLLKLSFTTLLVSIGATALLTTPAAAAPPNLCRDYARAALNQVQIALSIPACRPGLVGARWSADYRVHFNWCLGAPFPAVESERDARTGYLRACRGM